MLTPVTTSELDSGTTWPRGSGQSGQSRQVVSVEAEEAVLIRADLVDPDVVVSRICIATLTRRACDTEAGLDLTAESFAQAYLSRRRPAVRRKARRPPGSTGSPSGSSPATSGKGRPSYVRFAGSGSSDLSSISRVGVPRRPETCILGFRQTLSSQARMFHS